MLRYSLKATTRTSMQMANTFSSSSSSSSSSIKVTYRPSIAIFCRNIGVRVSFLGEQYVNVSHVISNYISVLLDFIIKQMFYISIIANGQIKTSTEKMYITS